MRSTVESDQGKFCAKILHVSIYLRILVGIDMGGNKDQQ
jgi:hypothetical protein